MENLYSRIQEKAEFAELERKQEEAAFMSDPDIGQFRLSSSWVMAGDAIFTVEIPEAYRGSMPEHYTYRVTKKEANGKWPDAWFVKLLTGPTDYTYMGKLVDGECRVTSRSNYLQDSPPVKLLNRILKRVFADELDIVESFGFRIHHEGRCGHCGRPLTTPESVIRGIGPVCFGRQG